MHFHTGTGDALTFFWTWGVRAEASLRGRPRGRLSEGAGLPEGVAPALLRGGDGPCSEGSRLLSSDDILYKETNRFINDMCLYDTVLTETHTNFKRFAQS